VNNHPNRSRTRKVASAAEVVSTTAPRTCVRKTPSVPLHDHDADWAALLASVQQSFNWNAETKIPLFRTDAYGLFDAFLDALPAEQQIHNCWACRRFVKEFGGLVRLHEDGTATPVMWSSQLPLPAFYVAAMAAVQNRVFRAKVVSPFLFDEQVWGTPRDPKGWTHLHIEAGRSTGYYVGLHTPAQAMSSRKEDFRTVSTALADFTIPTLEEALRVLDAELVHRSEKFLGHVRWLLDLSRRGAGRE
jgi:hypothetical protein